MCLSNDTVWLTSLVRPSSHGNTGGCECSSESTERTTGDVQPVIVPFTTTPAWSPRQNTQLTAPASLIGLLHFTAAVKHITGPRCVSSVSDLCSAPARSVLTRQTVVVGCNLVSRWRNRVNVSVGIAVTIERRLYVALRLTDHPDSLTALRVHCLTLQSLQLHT